VGCLNFIVARLTLWLKPRPPASPRARLDEHYAQVVFSATLRWDRPRLLVIREGCVPSWPRWEEATRCSRLHLPRLVSNLALPPEELWRDYQHRADMEIASPTEADLGADDFCMREFFATEQPSAAFLLLFNLLGEFQRARAVKPIASQPRCAHKFFFAVLSSPGRPRLVLHLSLPGWPQTHASRCWKTPYPTGPTRRSCILGSPLEPKSINDLYETTFTSDFRL